MAVTVIVEATFTLERETKGTYRYQEDDQVMPKIGTIYIKKYVLGAQPPKKLVIKIEGGY